MKAARRIAWVPIAVLAARNIGRNKARTALILGCIAIGVAGLLLSGGFVHDLLLRLGEAVIRSQTGHVQIAARGYFELGSRAPSKYLMSKENLAHLQLEQLPHVRASMRRLAFSGLLGNGRSSYPIVGEGIEAEPELELATALRFTAGRNLGKADRHAVIVGHGVATALSLRIGSVLNLVAPTVDEAVNTIEVEVVGIFQTFSKDYDDRVVKIPLASAQELLDTSSVNVAVLLLAQTEHTQDAAEAVLAKVGQRPLDVRTWDRLSDFYWKAVALYDRQFGVLRVIVLIVVLLAVAGAINVSVAERAGEFGTMRVLGNRQREVVALIMLEALFLGLLGAALGAVLGGLAAHAISEIGIPMPPPPNSNLGYVAEIPLVPSVVAGAFAIGISASVLAAVPSAARVTRMPLIAALQRLI